MSQPTPPANPLPRSVRWFAPWTWFAKWKLWQKWTAVVVLALALLAYIVSSEVLAYVLVRNGADQIPAVKTLYLTIYAPMKLWQDHSPTVDRFCVWEWEWLNATFGPAFADVFIEDAPP